MKVLTGGLFAALITGTMLTGTALAQGKGKLGGGGGGGGGVTPPISYSATLLGNLGASPGETAWSEAVGLNNVGAVVGRTSTGYGLGSAPFLWTEAGGMVDQNALIDPALEYFLDDPNATDGWKLLNAGGVNDWGQLTGSGYTFQNRVAGLQRAYRVDPPVEEGGYWTIVDLGNLGGGNGTAAAGINNSGDVAGHSVAADGKYHMFLVLGDDVAVMHDLGSFQGSATLAYDISNRVGDRIYIVGRTMSLRAILCTCTIGENGISHEYQDLGTLKTDDSGLAEAFGVNDQGQVVGYATANPSKGDTPECAFSYSNLGMVSLGTLSTHKTWNDSYAYAVNNSGVVVGQYSTVFPSYAPFYYSPDTGMVDLLQAVTNSGALSSFVTPRAINDIGVICGPRVFNYNEYDGEAFILVPNPPQ